MRIGQLKESVGTTLSMPGTKVICALLLSLFGTTSLAQTATTGAIVGRVGDTEGVAVPNITLTVTSVNLIRAQSATSGKDGVFRILNIPPGRYRVSANFDGALITSEAKGVEVNISKTSLVFILVPRRVESRSARERDRQSLKPPRAQTNTNSQGSTPSQAIKIDPKIGNAHAKLDETYARLRAEDKSVGDGTAGSEKRAGTSSLSVPDPVGAVPGPPTSAVELLQIYRVGIGDVLDVRLSKAPANASTLFTVSRHGLLEHPILAHPLMVAGLTPEEISSRIKAELKSLLVNEKPEVLVSVREYVSHTILVG